MTIPLRSIRLLSQHSDFLNRNTFLPGEIFFDSDSDTLRIMDGRNQSGKKIATQVWVENNLNTINNKLNLTDTTQSTSTATGTLTVAGGAGIAKNTNIGGTLAVTGNTTLTADLAVNGGDITTNQATFNLINVTPTTVNFAGGATTINAGNSLGTFTINNAAFVHNSNKATKIAVGTTASRPTPATGQIRFNTDLRTFEGYGDTSWGSLGGVKSVDGLTYIIPETSPGAANGELEFYTSTPGSSVTTKVGGWNYTLLNVATNLTVQGSATITGNLIVNGTTSTINSTILTVDDKNIELGSVASPTDVTASGGGITLKGTTDKTIIWNAPANAGGETAWTSSENVNLVTGKSYRINGFNVLTNQDALPASSTVTVGSSATSLSLGSNSLTGTTTVNSTTVTLGRATTLNVNGANPTVATTSTGTLTLFNTNLATVNAFNSATTVNLGTNATTINVGATTGTTTVNNNVIITGNLDVQGQTSTQTSSNLTVENKNVILGNVASPATPSDSTANAGGIVLKGTTDKSLLWYSSTSSWTSTDHFDLASGKSFRINDTVVLSNNTLGSGVVNSSLTSVGTLTSLTTSGTIAANGGDITSTQTTFNLVNVTPTTVNFAGGATAVNVGSTTGTMTIKNPTVVGDASNTSVNLWNTNATTVNAFGGASAINIGATGGTATFNGTVKADTIDSINTTATVYNSTATTINAFGAATNVTMGGAGVRIAVGASTTRSDLSFGDQTSNGTTTPVLIDMGGTYSSAAGDNPKIKLWTDGTYYMGLGISSDTMEFIGSRSIYGYKWYSSTTNTMTLSSGGNLTLAGSLTESSSIALKENVQPIQNALDSIKQLVGVTYDRRNGSAKNEAGLIAEAVDQVLPNLVTHKQDGSAEGINYTKLTAYLIEAVKELDRKLEAILAK